MSYVQEHWFKHNSMNKTELIYLVVAVLVWLAGYFHNGRFVRPKWKIPGKFLFYVGLAFLMTHWYLHWALLFIIGHPLIGLLFHYKVCKKNQINWLTCQPRDKYLEIQEKWAKGKFNTGNPIDND